MRTERWKIKGNVRKDPQTDRHTKVGAKDGSAVARHRRLASGVKPRLPGPRPGHVHRKFYVSTPHIIHTRAGSRKRARSKRKRSRVFCSSESLGSFPLLSAGSGSTVRWGRFQAISQRVDARINNVSPTWAMNKYILWPPLVSHMQIVD